MTEPASKTSPFVIAASIAVIIFSIVGIGAFTGLIPGRAAKTEPPAATTAQTEEVPAPPATDKPAAVTDNAKPKQQESTAKPVYKPASERPAAKPARTRETAGTESKAPANVCANCGVITAIRTVEQAGEGSGLGMIAGGVAGALLGSQIGSGRGKDVATIAGAVGGGYAGHQVEKKVKTIKHYEITVRMDDGSHRTMVQEAEPVFAIGEKVKIIDGALVRN
jgi:outer membrane lipoprotein SlyB